MATQRDPQLVQAGKTPRLSLFGLAVLLPMLITGGSLAWAAVDEGPQRLVAGSVPLTSGLILGGTGIFTLVLWWVLDRAMRRHALWLDANRLQVRTSFYTVDLALSELRLEAARVVDLVERPEYRPVLKTNGYALPGFRSGHFRLRSGDKAFVAIAGGPRALWIPTTRDKTLLLQPDHPETLLSRLRELAQAQSRR
jgi:hypothetical protein